MSERDLFNLAYVEDLRRKMARQSEMLAEALAEKNRAVAALELYKKLSQQAIGNMAKDLKAAIEARNQAEHKAEMAYRELTALRPPKPIPRFCVGQIVKSVAYDGVERFYKIFNVRYYDSGWEYTFGANAHWHKEATLWALTADEAKLP